MYFFNTVPLFLTSFLSQGMNNVLCESMGHDRSSLCRDLVSIRPRMSPLASKPSDQTKISLIRFLYKQTKTGSDKILVASGS